MPLECYAKSIYCNPVFTSKNIIRIIILVIIYIFIILPTTKKLNYMISIKLKLLLFSSLLMLNFSNAQKIKEENGIITLDGEPYVKMIKTKAWAIFNNFTIQNLSGVDLATFNYRTKTTRKWDEKKRKYVEGSTVYYTVDFAESGGHAAINEQLSKKMVVKIFLKNNLIKDGVIDPLAEKQYINRLGGRYPMAIPIHESKSPVVINDNLISIDGKIVGKFIEKYSDDTEDKILISVYETKHNEKVAEAITSADDPIEWDVKTMSDDKSTSIMYDSPEEKEKLFKWLIQKKYLK